MNATSSYLNLPLRTLEQARLDMLKAKGLETEALQRRQRIARRQMAAACLVAAVGIR